MGRVLGDLSEGVVAKIADDLYCGSDDEAELLYKWKTLLPALDRCNLGLSASKTVVAPKSTTILGWIWPDSTLQASPHRISKLSSCTPPTTVKGLRSFISAYKVLASLLLMIQLLESPQVTKFSGQMTYCLHLIRPSLLYPLINQLSCLNKQISFGL